MVIQAATLAQAEPILVAAMAGLSGYVILRFASTAIKRQREWDDFKVSWFGNPLDDPPNGMKRKLDTFMERVEGNWREQEQVNVMTAKTLGELVRRLPDQSGARFRDIDGSD